MPTRYAITDLQFGSTGKGLLAGYLANKLRPDTVVCAFGPNAGHTFIDKKGNKFVNIMLPNGIVADSVKQVLIGPGALIDPDRMLEEIEIYSLGGTRQVKIGIHECAAVVQPRHREAEARYGFKIGSTMKGTGEAFIEKIRRSADGQPIIARDFFRGSRLEPFVVPVAEYNDLMDSAGTMQIEGCQGFSLGINQGFYPYCTSRECSTAQLLSDTAVPLNQPIHVYGVARTFPIRVNNRNHTSGPGYRDQIELQWSDIGVRPELTTVTKLPRRLFTFSKEQIRQAVRMNSVDQVFLNFCNYLGKRNSNSAALRNNLARWVGWVKEAGADVRWLGWGPNESDVEEILYDAV